MNLREAARVEYPEVFAALGSGPKGLSSDEATRRREVVWPNSFGERKVRATAVLGRQLRNPLLILLIATAVTSAALGDRAAPYIIVAIIGLSVGLGFFNEYRAERAMLDLIKHVRHRAIAIRRGQKPQC